MPGFDRHINIKESLTQTPELETSLGHNQKFIIPVLDEVAAPRNSLVPPPPKGGQKKFLTE